MNYKKLYETLYQQGYHIDILTNIGLKLVETITNKFEFESILDVGCSQGLSVQAYQKHNKDAHGVDISPTAIKKSKELYISNCVQGSMIDLPFKDNQFDAVVSSDVLEHLIPEDVKQGIHEVCRVSSSYLFLKISQKKEGNKTWINKLHDQGKFLGLGNLHTTVMRHKSWIEVVESEGKFVFSERIGKLLVFKRKDLKG